jgi:hypothetical protein
MAALKERLNGEGLWYNELASSWTTGNKCRAFKAAAPVSSGMLVLLPATTWILLRLRRIEKPDPTDNASYSSPFLYID